jgi:hypothetical protein
MILGMHHLQIGRCLTVPVLDAYGENPCLLAVDPGSEREATSATDTRSRTRHLPGEQAGSPHQEALSALAVRPGSPTMGRCRAI